jgi:hypothetical protein
MSAEGQFMSTATPPVTPIDILIRSMDVHPEQMTAEVATFFLGLELSEQDRQRTAELAAKARDGSLSALEEQEIEEYRRTGKLIEKLKIKARMALEKGNP